MFRRGLVARDPAEIAATLELDGALIAGELSRECSWVQVQGNPLEKEPTLRIYLRGAKDSCELNHTCRHSPAVPAAATHHAAPAAAAGYC